MTEMVYGALPVRSGEPLIPKWWRTVDKITLGCVLALFGVGLLLGFAASPPLAAKTEQAPFFYVQKQAMFGAIALGLMVFASMQSPATVRRYAVVGFAFAFIALILLPFIGSDHGKGATRWLSIAGISLQPSEFLKPVFVLTAAWMLAAAQEINGPPGRALSFALTAILVSLLVMQPDFGQASLVLFAWAVMYFISGAPMTLLIAITGLVIVGGFAAYEGSEHFASRINGFMAADLDPRSQLGYAEAAIREGGFFGVGVGEGTVKVRLPDAHTDFIIAVAAEEYGLVLVLGIIALYVTILVRSLGRLMRERDPFIRLAGAGLVAAFGAQAMINLGVAVRLLPAKGMTLPFVSNGGSSMVASGLALGMLLALTRSRPQNQISDLLGGRPAAHDS